MAGLYEQMVEDATSFVDASYDEGFKPSPEQRDAIHLAGIRRRFTTLRHSVKALDRLATEQGINDINSLDGVVPLFLPHTAYKRSAGHTSELRTLMRNSYAVFCLK